MKTQPAFSCYFVPEKRKLERVAVEHGPPRIYRAMYAEPFTDGLSEDLVLLAYGDGHGERTEERALSDFFERAEKRESNSFEVVRKDDLDSLPDGDVVSGAVHHVGHHPGPFIQIHEGNDVGNELIERRRATLPHNGEGIDGSPTRSLPPREFAGALTTKGPRIELETVAGRTVLNEQYAARRRRPVRL
jgi:hypothetical protein